MIRRIVDDVFIDGKHYVEAAGLSTDSKPTEGLITGSKFTEVNTGKRFLFDEVSETWTEDPAGYIQEG